MHKTIAFYPITVLAQQIRQHTIFYLNLTAFSHMNELVKVSTDSNIIRTLSQNNY